MSHLKAILELLQRGQRFFLVTHVNPDGDALGSMFAMALALEMHGKEAWCYLEEELPYVYRWLPGAEQVKMQYPSGKGWIGLVVDCAEARGVGKAIDFLNNLSEIIVLDHHEVTGSLGTHRLIEATYATGGLIFRILKALSWPLTKEIAENLYVAIYSDTGGFRFNQTTAETFEVACSLVKAGAEPAKIAELLYEHYPLSRFCVLNKVLDHLDLYAQGKLAISFIRYEDFCGCNASRADLEDFASLLRSIEGVEVSALIKEYKPHEIAVSLRSRGKVNVAKFALRFGGGGHRCAAGFKFKGKMEQLLSLLRQELETLSL